MHVHPPFITLAVQRLYWFCTSFHSFGRVHMKGDIYGAFNLSYYLRSPQTLLNLFGPLEKSKGAYVP
jgi:hypothetical protein